MPFSVQKRQKVEKAHRALVGQNGSVRFCLTCHSEGKLNAHLEICIGQ